MGVINQSYFGSDPELKKAQEFENKLK